MRKTEVLYLICANDRLETAFFCGTSRECAEVLGLKNTDVFHSGVSHGRKFMKGFVHIERVKLKEGDQ